ncbi:mitochondrial 37S ribosomal protein uS10m [Kockiozyma suomiensis]|uniref:mitochondrial 37S ribosomal protein uS10m n=1 Tax=Kockiozyma suomiensis TaxID=1337062 RepID=UPI003343A818
MSLRSLRLLRTSDLQLCLGIPRTLVRFNSHSSAGNANIQEYDRTVVEAELEPYNRATDLPEFINERQVYINPKTGQAHMTSSLKIWPRTERPMPMNVELTHYSPIRLPKTHDEKVCDMVLYSYSVDSIDLFSDFAMRAAFYLNMPARLSPLPTKTERWTMPKSPFVQTKTKQNYERVTHKRIIKVYDSDLETIELWLGFLRKHELAGVGMKANMFCREGLEGFDIEAALAEKKAADQEKAAKKTPTWQSRLERRAARKTTATTK